MFVTRSNVSFAIFLPFAEKCAHVLVPLWMGHVFGLAYQSIRFIGFQYICLVKNKKREGGLWESTSKDMAVGKTKDIINLTSL